MEKEVFDGDSRNILKSHKKKKRKKVSSDSDSDSSAISIDEEVKRKLLKKLKKLKKKIKEKKKKKKNKKDKECDKKKREKERNKSVGSKESEKSKNFAPMTKEEWEKQQNTLLRVYDEETGRTRLVRATGEIVEECVSRERQAAINKQATLKDGEYFQKVLSMNLK